MYDVIIVGGGIGGLYCALELLKRNKNICICEKYKNVGGRVETFYKDDYMWEAGAGRISKSHKLVLELLKHYDQPIVEISKDLLYKENGSSCLEPNLFEKNISIFFSPLKLLKKTVLQQHTLKEICIQIHGKEKTEEFLDRFPYRAEVEILRADLGLESFTHEMGSHDGYFVAVHGLSKLIECMKDDILSKGGKIMNNHTLVNITDKKDKIVSEYLFHKESKELKESKESIILESHKLICAVESDALHKIPFFKNFKTLQCLKMEPLLRTYAIYNTSWFSEYPRIVTKSPIRYFIPINYTKGVAMISYTDSRDTDKYHNIMKKYGEESLGKHIQNNLNDLFGSVPNYNFFKAHYWAHGATYWLPGNYNVMEESKNSLKPFDSEVYLVGESFSLKQAWMEGSLLQVKKLFTTYRF